MNHLLIATLFLALSSCTAQKDFNSDVAFTKDLKEFQNLSKLKESLSDVEIIALGENTHGLGEVFKSKVELVKFLHQELGFDLVLFESGYGDAALAWENINSLSARAYTSVFSSNSYYQSEELEQLSEYAIQHQKSLNIQGLDCQPQQDYLIQRMEEIIFPIDSVFSKSVASKMRSFNQLYQYENDKDSIAFFTQRDQFIAFLNEYEELLQKHKDVLNNTNVSEKEISILQRTFEIFRSTYADIPFGGMMAWPMAYNLRDKSMFDIVNWFREEHPTSKIIIWAQNSHIENATKPDYNVDWMGHHLKNKYKDKYYSIGTIVYSGKDLRYNGTAAFEHDSEDFLAYHLNKFEKEKFVVDLRSQASSNCTDQLLSGMESNGNTASFVAKDRFDALLFIKYSDVPKLIKR